MRPLFSLGAELPSNGHDTGHDDTSNQGVAAPVGGLRVPTTGWGPDMLRVTVVGYGLDTVASFLVRRFVRIKDLRDFSAAAALGQLSAQVHTGRSGFHSPF